MATFSRVKTWVSNEVLSAADLNAEFDNLLNNMIPAGIEDASTTVSEMQTTVDPGGVGTESQATDLLGEIQRLRFKLKQGIGGAQWYSTPEFDLTGPIPKANMATVGQQISSACGDFTYGPSTTFADVTNLSVTITTGGRPVFIGLIYDTAQTVSGIIEANDLGSGTNITVTMNYKFLRGTDVVHFGTVSDRAFAGGGAKAITMPLAVVQTYDFPVAGTYTYKMQINTSTGASFDSQGRVRHAKLLVFEI